MSNPKFQHYVPQCYLKQFRDPKSDLKDPFVWIFDKDGKNRRRDKVKNVLAVNDLYTLKFQGQKNYVIEKSLSDLEGKYASIFENKILLRQPLNDEEHATVCLFLAVMMQRTLRFKSVVENFADQIISHTQELEKQHGKPPKASEELRHIKKDIHKTSVVENAPELALILQRMNTAFLCVDGSSAKFITSDDPCNMFNPGLQWTPYSFGGTGLVQKGTQVTLPLSPEILLCKTWQNLHGYIQIPASLAQDQNRMIRGFAHKYFISHSPRPRRGWFRKFPLSPSFFFTLIWTRVIPRFIFGVRARFKNGLK